MPRRCENAKFHHELMERGYMPGFRRALEEAMYQHFMVVVCAEILVILRGWFKESKRAADKIQASCNQRLDAFSAVRCLSQTQGAFHSRFD